MLEAGSGGSSRGTTLTLGDTSLLRSPAILRSILDDELLGVDRPHAADQPDERYFSMPSTEVGAEVRRNRALNCWPWVRSLTHWPEAMIHSPAEMTAACPTTVTTSRLDGYAATRRIKADPALRSIPIIAVTSYALSGEEKKARAAGCDDYVPKPFSPRELLAKIRQYLPE